MGSNQLQLVSGLQVDLNWSLKTGGCIHKKTSYFYLYMSRDSFLHSILPVVLNSVHNYSRKYIFSMTVK